VPFKDASVSPVCGLTQRNRRAGRPGAVAGGPVTVLTGWTEFRCQLCRVNLGVGSERRLRRGDAMTKGGWKSFVPEGLEGFHSTLVWRRYW